MASASKLLGTQQLLAEQGGNRLTRLEYHGERRGHRAQGFLGIVSPGAVTPIASSTGWVARPIGYCQGFFSPKSPRMLTSISSGKRPPLVNDNMLMQLPTPLLCNNKTPRASEIGTSQQGNILLLRRQGHRMHLRVRQGEVDEAAMSGIGHVGKLHDLVLARQIVDVVLPA